MSRGICFRIGIGIGIGIMVSCCFGAGAGDILGPYAYSSVYKFSGAGSGIGTNVDVFQYLDVSPQCILKVYM